MKEFKCDLMVAGAGIAGMCAAVSAARKGLKVVLINDRAVFGGNASSEVGVPVSGGCHQGFNPSIYAKETGLVEELRMERAHYQSEGGYGELAISDAIYMDFIYNEKNISVLLNTVVEDCEVVNGIMKCAYARHSVNNELFKIVSPLYVDATGNGTLAFSADAEYRVGRECKAEFDEKWAPETADKSTMGNSLFFETEDVGHPVKFTPPAFAHDIAKMDFMKNINKPENFRSISPTGPNWTYEFGGQLDILADHDETELELRRLIFGIWDYVKNSGKFPGSENRVLKRVYSKAGTRESRRFVGDYILNENDVENKVNFADSVAIGGWPMDIHAPKGIYDELPASNFVPVTSIYNIPLRSLYSKDVPNIMLAGRDISATHIALGSTRVMGTCGCLGQAVGTAAYVCKKYGVLPRDVVSEHMNELQEILATDDQTIVHIKDSLCEGFSATADSEAVFENTVKEDVMPIERDYYLSLMCNTAQVDSLDVYLEGDGTLEYMVYTGSLKESFIPDKKVLSASIDINGAGWYTLPIGVEVGEDSKIYLIFKQNESLSLGINAIRPMGAISGRMHTKDNHVGMNHDTMPLYDLGEYIAKDHAYEFKRNILFKNITPTQNAYSADKAINGYSRPYGSQNIWLPASLPATITLVADKPANINTLEVIFDTVLDQDEFMLKGIRPTVVKDFDVKVTTAKGEEVHSVCNNYQRVAKVKLDTVDVQKIELTVKSNYGAPSGIFGFRIK